MVSRTLFSSASAEWPTPDAYFKQIEAEFGPFDLDPAATAENAKACKFYTEEEDGLKQPWFGRVWVNCPYGRNATKKWVDKAVRSTANIPGEACADLVVMLLPARTDTVWWHLFVLPFASEIRFIKGRLRFGDAKNSAPFPSVLVIFRRAETR